MTYHVWAINSDTKSINADQPRQKVLWLEGAYLNEQTNVWFNYAYYVEHLSSIKRWWNPTWCLCDNISFRSILNSYWLEFLWKKMIISSIFGLNFQNWLKTLCIRFQGQMIELASQILLHRHAHTMRIPNWVWQLKACARSAAFSNERLSHGSHRLYLHFSLILSQGTVIAKLHQDMFSFISSSLSCSLFFHSMSLCWSIFIKRYLDIN